jgi:hypothetical protein
VWFPVGKQIHSQVRITLHVGVGDVKDYREVRITFEIERTWSPNVWFC